MKKLLPLLVVIILVINGIGAVAVFNDKQMENKPQSTQEWKLKIKVKPRLFGYTVIISNDGTETLKGNLTITIGTHWTLGMVLLGREFIWPEDKPYDMNMEPGKSLTIKLEPILGFGLITIVMDAVLLTDEGDYINSVEANGFMFLIMAFFNCEPLIIP